MGGILKTVERTALKNLTAILAASVFLLASCVPTTSSTKKRSTAGGSTTNSAATVPVTQGRIFEDNPVQISGNPEYPTESNFNTLLRSTLDLVFLTNAQTLTNPCDPLGTGLFVVSTCYNALPDRLQAPLVNNEKKWAYDANGAEFVQVNAFGHKKKMIDQWFEHQTNYVTSFANSNDTSLKKDSTFTEQYFSNFAFWFGSTTSLVTWANCDFSDNAFFSPSETALCFGRDSLDPKLWFAQDPTIMYHELGHGFTRIMLNTRNKMEGAGVIPYSSALAYRSYDEGGMVSEGIADWFSYYMNSRSHFAEWALGRYLNQSRPLRESDSSHTAAVSEADDARLAYPDYLFYDPNFPESPFEDIHYAGQIISHFLVALTVDLQNECSISLPQAKELTAGILHESLAELGDLTSKGTKTGEKGYINLVDNSDWAFEWLRAYNPINMRKFAQSMARKTYQMVGPGFSGISNACLSGYTKDRIERLWDSYGMLLFKTYNLNGSSHFEADLTGAEDDTNALGHQGSALAVSSANRLRTVLVNKSSVILDPTNGAPPAFVFDDRAQLRSVANALRQTNGVILSEQLDADLAFNNGNGKISPGEFIGIALNLYNTSNSTISGVQILANDWQHVNDLGKLCNNQGDNFPSSEAEGAAAAADTICNAPPLFEAAGGNPDSNLDPICVVQLNEENATRWAQQDELLAQMDGLTENNCLGDDPKSCFLRSPKGADVGWMSSIDGQMNWSDSLPKDANGSVNIGGHQAVFFEVSPWISPGTTFLCRFRVRFSNCDDCYHDVNKSNDDYLDNKYATGLPFKVINLQFTVVD